MPLKTLRVRRKGTAMVPHYGSNVRKFVGWKHDPTQGEDWIDPMTGESVKDHATGGTKKHGAFVGHDEAVEVPNTVEFRRHVSVDKDLWAADQDTATECGVPFDPTFGEAPTKSAAPAAEEH